MIVYKRLFLRIFFLGECLVFLWFYLYGKQGVTTLLKTNHDHTMIVQDCLFLTKEIESLTQHIELFKTNSFYLEKKVRETLSMARPDEKIFFIDKPKEKK